MTTSFTSAFATIDFTLVTREGSGRKARHDFRNSYRQIHAGHWLAWRNCSPESASLWPSYYWQVVEVEGALVLQTPWGSPQVVLTQELAEDLCFTDYSRQLSLTDFPDEARWFAACHWAVMFHESLHGPGLYLRLDRFGAPRGGITSTHVPSEVLSDRARLRTYLLNVLYQLTHPNQFDRRPEDAKELSETELVKFTREISRKAEKRGLS